MKRFLRSRLLLSLVALIMVGAAVVVPLSSSLLRSHAAGPSTLKDNVPASTVAADPFNSRLAIQVGTDGRFNIGAFPDPSTGGATTGSWDLMYSWPNPPGTSFSTLNIDGTNNIYGSSGTQTQAPQDTDPKTNQSSWQIGDIQASQTLQLTLNDQTAQEDNAKIAYSLKNTGTVAHTVGLRIMVDTEVNGNDGAILRVPGTGLVRKESEFTGTAVPDTMQSYFDVTDSNHVAAVTLRGAGATAPDRLVIAAWPHLRDNVYDYTIDPNYDFTDPNVARPDSAYAAYWNPVSLAPGQSLSYVTYYGLSQLTVNLTPPLALGVSGPATLSVINNAYSPNPFTVTATVLDNGTADATNVALTLHLPTGLSLSSGTATQNIGTLPVGQERDVSWSVQAAPQTSQQTLDYSVDAVASNTPLKNVATQITLPAISTLTHQVLFVLLQGINTSLSVKDTMKNGGLGEIPDFVNEARFGPRGSIHIPGIVPFLKSHGYGKAQFLAYSYSTSNPINGHPLSYSCLDTFKNPLSDDAVRLSFQIVNFLKTEPTNTITDIYLIGHSLGGAVALTYLTALVEAPTTVQPLPANAHLAGVVTLDSPVGGVSGNTDFVSFIFDLFTDKLNAHLSGCDFLNSQKQMVSVFDLVKVFKTTSNSTQPPTDDGNPGSQGAHASILKAIFGGTALTNQAVVEAAAATGTAVLTIGNTEDFLYNPGKCTAGLFPTFTNSQWIGDEGPIDATKEHNSPLTVYGREFKAGLPCLQALDDPVNHKEVYNNNAVESGLLQLLSGKAPSSLAIAPPEP